VAVIRPALAQYEVKQDIAIKTAYQYLQENAPDAKSWYLTVATPVIGMPKSW
jgi:hypothetical protein